MEGVLINCKHSADPTKTAILLVHANTEAASPALGHAASGGKKIDQTMYRTFLPIDSVIISDSENRRIHRRKFRVLLRCRPIC